MLISKCANSGSATFKPDSIWRRDLLYAKANEIKLLRRDTQETQQLRYSFCIRMIYALPNMPFFLLPRLVTINRGEN